MSNVSQIKLAPRKFTISYELPNPDSESSEQPSTDEHTIDAKTLGSSLVNLVELIEQSDKLLNGEASTVQVNVKANKEGSFQIEFVAWLYSGGIDVLQTLGITAASVTAMSGTVMGVLKGLRNRKIQSTLSKRDAKGSLQTFLKLDDGSEIPCAEEVKTLVMSHTVRTKLANVIQKPALGHQNAKVKLFEQGSTDTGVVIEGDEIDSFKAPTKRQYEEITITPETVNLVFIQINNSARTGWRAKHVDEEFAVKMDDSAFLERINAKQDFPVKDELFEVVLETTKRIYDGKTTFSYRITEVKRHRTSAEKKIL